MGKERREKDSKGKKGGNEEKRNLRGDPVRPRLQEALLYNGVTGRKNRHLLEIDSSDEIEVEL